MKLFSLIFLFSASVFASGVSVKGGGSGVDLGSHVALLDLVESGVDRTPFFGEHACQTATFETLREVLPSNAQIRFCQKLYDVAALDPALATAFTKTVAALTWVFTDQPLKVIDPDPIIDVKTVQLAVRNGNRVIIQRELFQRMSPEHQAALIIHEVAAALVSVEIQSPLPVRTLVGNLFREAYIHRSTYDVLNDLRYFPNRRVMKYDAEGSTQIQMPDGFIETSFDLVNGADYFPSFTLVWTDRGGSSRSLDSFYVSTESADRVEEVLRSCENETPGHRLLQISAMYVSPTVIARSKLENGTPTDRYNFHSGLEMHSLIAVERDEKGRCSEQTRALLQDLRVWLSTFKTVLAH